MPQASPKSEPVAPGRVSETEAEYIRRIIHRYYGKGAVIRNWGPDPKHLLLHVETDRAPQMEKDECLGFLMCEIVRDSIELDVLKRGTKVRGNHKLAYRQGVIV